MIVKHPNLAADEDVVAQVVNDWAPLIDRTRRERIQTNKVWERYDNIWKARPDYTAGYMGRLGIYLTIGRRVIENWVTTLKQQTFPQSGKWFTAHANSVDDEADIPTLEAVVRRYLFDVMKLRRFATPALRQLVVTGNMPFEMGWRRSEEDVPTLAEVQKGGAKSFEDKVQRIVTYLGPTIRFIPPYRMYVWPPSANDIDDLSLIF